MENHTEPEENFKDEFHNLGKNLASAFRAAWENPERKKLQDEIESGLAEFSSAVKSEIENIKQSPVGQQVKSEVDHFQERIKNGQVDTKVREELLTALRTINTELRKTTQKWTSSQANKQQTGESTTNEQEYPDDTSNPH